LVNLSYKSSVQKLEGLQTRCQKRDCLKPGRLGKGLASVTRIRDRRAGIFGADRIFARNLAPSHVFLSIESIQ